MNTNTDCTVNDELHYDICPICQSVCGRPEHAGNIGIVNAINLIYDSRVIKGNLNRVKALKLPAAELDKVVRELTLLYSLPIPEEYKDNLEGTWNYLTGFASVIMKHVTDQINKGARIEE